MIVVLTRSGYNTNRLKDKLKDISLEHIGKEILGI